MQVVENESETDNSIAADNGSKKEVGSLEIEEIQKAEVDSPKKSQGKLILNTSGRTLNYYYGYIDFLRYLP